MNLVFDPTVTLPFLLSALALIIAWWRTRRHVIDDRLKTGSERMDRHDSRLQALEQTVKQLPSHKDIHKIEMAIVEQNGALGRIEAVLEGNQKIMARLETIVTRHEDHLLSESRK